MWIEEKLSLLHSFARCNGHKDDRGKKKHLIARNYFALLFPSLRSLKEIAHTSPG